jgi:hypothetical protein
MSGSPQRSVKYRLSLSRSKPAAEPVKVKTRLILPDVESTVRGFSTVAAFDIGRPSEAAD